MCAYRRYAAVYRRRYKKGSYYRRRTSPFKDFRQTSTTKRGNKQKTITMISTERIVLNDSNAIKNDIEKYGYTL